MIGVDLDNTIICYSTVFHSVALDEGLIDAGTAAGKDEVKRAILRTRGNEEWTRLQGIVYGPRLSEAESYPGAIDFFRGCRQRGIPTSIISHKTQYPAVGDRHDLRDAAMKWLQCNHWLDTVSTGLTQSSVEFVNSKAEKIAAMIRRGCSIVVDDLPEVFREADFPNSIMFILFDPHDSHPSWTETTRVKSWAQITSLVLENSAKGRS
jgi:hypothetical protein